MTQKGKEQLAKERAKEALSSPDSTLEDVIIASTVIESGIFELIHRLAMNSSDTKTQ